MTDRDLSYWLDLGKRAKACKGFEWKRGMVALYINPDDPGCNGLPVVIEDEVALFVDGATLVTFSVNAEGITRCAEVDHIPDLRDPGTVGHCLAMMREAWGEPEALVETWRHPTHKAWRRIWDVGTCSRSLGPSADTEAEAIIAAWEAAP